MAYSGYLPFVPDFGNYPREDIVDGWGESFTVVGKNPIDTKVGNSTKSKVLYMEWSKAVTRRNSQNFALPPQGAVRELTIEVRDAIKAIADCGKMHPEPKELTWNFRRIPSSVLSNDMYKTECLGPHQVITMLNAINNVSLETLRAITSTAYQDMPLLARGLWALYKDAKVRFQKSELFGTSGGFPSNDTDETSGIYKVADQVDKLFNGGRNANANATSSIIFAMLLYFLQDPEFDILWAGYSKWLNGYKDGGTAWASVAVRIKNKIMENLKSKMAERERETCANGFISAIGKLDYHLLIGLSADMLKHAVQFSGMAMEHTTEFHDSNKAFSDRTTLSNRDATLLYKVFREGRHEVYALVPPLRNRMVKTYYWRPNRFSFFQVFFAPATDAKDYVRLLNKKRYINSEDVEVVEGELIYTDDDKSDMDSNTPLEWFLWMQGFPHYAIQEKDEIRTIQDRREVYCMERRVSALLDRSIHKSQ